jgi:hypothetical protein
MRKRLLLLIGIIITGAILIACGGGGGGSGGQTGASASPNVLLGTIPGVSSSTMTIGDATAASGDVRLVLLDKIFNLFKSFSNPFVRTAYAQSISACQNSSSNQLIGSQDLETWNIMNLGSEVSSTNSSCVTSFQDAGNYIVLATHGLTDSSGNICDLVVIEKSSGNTTCMNLALANRSSTGNPKFMMGANGYQWNTSQLTKNGNYFFIPFYTTQTNAAYVGFYRIDFTGNSPAGKIAYMEYGTQVYDCDGSPTVNGNNLLWTMGYWILENGNFTFDQFNVSQCSNSLPNFAAGISKYYYVDVNNSLDPLNTKKYLFDQHTVPVDYAGPDARGPYMIDNANSPLGQWIQKNLDNNAGNVWDFGGAIMSSASNSPSDLSFYVVIGGGNGSIPTACTNAGTSVYGVMTGMNGRQLIKVSIINGALIYQDYGTTNIGNGWGTLPTTDNVYLSDDGLNFITLHWTADADNNLKVMKILRPLSSTACDTFTLVSPINNVLVPASLSGTLAKIEYHSLNLGPQLPYTYRAKDYVYMYGFGSASWMLNCSTSMNGCQIPSDAQVWAYNKSMDSVSVVPIVQLTGDVVYYSTGTSTTSSSNSVSNTLVDSDGINYWYSLGVNGINKMVKFPSGFKPSNGFIMGSN